MDSTIYAPFLEYSHLFSMLDITYIFMTSVSRKVLDFTFLEWTGGC